LSRASWLDWISNMSLTATFCTKSLADMAPVAPVVAAPGAVAEGIVVVLAEPGGVGWATCANADEASSTPAAARSLAFMGGTPIQLAMASHPFQS
jgi:hypothetical protein